MSRLTISSVPGGTSNQRAPTIKKIIFVDRQTFRVKTSIEVVEYDISGVKDHIIYRSDSISGGIFSIQIRPNERPLLDSIAFYGEPNISKTINKKIGGGYEIEYPYYVYVASDETETDEVATRFIYFPPPDTDEQWLEQVEPRITNLARCYVDGIPGQHSRIDGLDNRVGTADEAGQLSIGYLRWQFEKHRDGITGTDNQVYTTKEELEDLIEKMEERFPSKDAVNKFYYRHPSQKWGSSSTRGQIYIAGDDHDFGEKIHDTFHAYVSSGIPRQTRNVGPTDEVRKAQENSDRDLAEIKQAFVRGTISDKDTIITKRTVEPQEYTPPERNSKLSDLRVVRQNGDLLFPSGLSTPTEFSSDVTEYNFTTSQSPGGLGTHRIEATLERSESTVTGTGVLADLKTPVDGLNVYPVVVTSEDGHGTTTYNINITRTTS